MSNPAKLIFSYGLVLLLYPSLLGQEKLPVPDAQAILKKTLEVYSGLNSYHFVHEILVESKKQGEKDLQTDRSDSDGSSLGAS